MKMTVFLRLIRTVACGVVVLGASNAYAQANSGIDDGITFGTLEAADEEGNAVDSVRAGKGFTQTQAPAAGSSSRPSAPQAYYPPGVEIPLTEREIPGSAYFVGPDGERIDASKLMNQAPPQQTVITGEGKTLELSPGKAFSLEGVYDGTLAFPMGTLPTTPFGERILSQVPADESTDGKSQSAEIQGALLDENGNPVDGAASNSATAGMENGVPVDQIVRPDNSPGPDIVEDASDSMAKSSVVVDDAPGKPMGVVKPKKSGGIKGLKSPVKIFSDPNTGQVTLIGNGEDTALVAKLLEAAAKEAPSAKRDSRMKKLLKTALSENEELKASLEKANSEKETLAKQVEEMKAAVEKQDEMSQKAETESQKPVAELQAKLKAAESEKADLMKLMKVASEVAKAEISGGAEKLEMMESKLKDAESRYEETVKAMQDAEQEANKKVEMLVAEAEKNAAQAEAKIAAAEANAEQAKAEALALSEKMAADSASADTTALAITGAAGAAADMMAKAPAADVSGVVADQADDMARKAKEAKAAAELEVSRKLKEMEERKKEADAAKDAADAAEAAASDASDEAKMAPGDKAEESVLSLDDQIKRLKAKRDQQIAESETRIRAKQQREIDKLLEEGKAVDSDEVKSAVEKMKGAIKSSEEKLRSRFLRRLERLKEAMKKSLK